MFIAVHVWSLLKIFTTRTTCFQQNNLGQSGRKLDLKTDVLERKVIGILELSETAHYRDFAGDLLTVKVVS